MREVPIGQQWASAQATVDWLAHYQPDDEWSHLEAVQLVALGRLGLPGVEMQWRQGQGDDAAHFGLTLTVESLMSSVDYEEWLEPPSDPLPEHWLGVLCLAVYEPHERAVEQSARWWFDDLP